LRAQFGRYLGLLRGFGGTDGGGGVSCLSFEGNVDEFGGYDGVFRVDMFDGGAVFREDTVFELGRELVEDAVQDGAVYRVEEVLQCAPIRY